MADLLTVAAHAEADHDGRPQSNLGEECTHENGPRVARHDAPARSPGCGTSARTAAMTACALALAAPRALDVCVPNTKLADVLAAAISNNLNALGLIWQ